MNTAGYSKTPLSKKLGFKEGFVVRLINPPPYYNDLFEYLPNDIVYQEETHELNDLIHYFETDAKLMTQTLGQLKNEIKQNGMIWVSWPKKASKVPTDIIEDTIRNHALKIGLVDIKVCAVDEVWSGLKLVIPVKNRK
ncbi:MAG TPA: DUF3052 family protein [Fulvivirga sp.]|nr:DUF3052 family protein [Fulvivirga sp.]